MSYSGVLLSATAAIFTFFDHNFYAFILKNINKFFNQNCGRKHFYPSCPQSSRTLSQTTKFQLKYTMKNSLSSTTLSFFWCVLAAMYCLKCSMSKKNPANTEGEKKRLHATVSVVTTLNFMNLP